MTKYVAGLLFSPSREHVLLIRKNRPAWQAGKLNGIGGHIEEGEIPLAAMMREFKEETGMSVKNWKHFCKLSGDGWQVEWYKSFDKVVYRGHACDEGDISWFPVQAVVNGGGLPIPNMRWLLMLALDKDDVTAVVTEPGGSEFGSKKGG